MTGISSAARCSGCLFLLVHVASGEWELHLGIEDLSVGGITGICWTLCWWGYHCLHKWLLNGLRNAFIAKYCKSEHFFGKHWDRVLLGSDDITRVCSCPCHSWHLAPHHLNCCYWDKWAHTLAHGITLHCSWLWRILGTFCKSALSSSDQCAGGSPQCPHTAPPFHTRGRMKDSCGMSGLWGNVSLSGPWSLGIPWVTPPRNNKSPWQSLQLHDWLHAAPSGLAWVLNQMYLSVQKTSHVHHLLENVGQVVGGFIVKFWGMGSKVSASNPFD